MKFYTNIALNRGDILLRGFNNGKRVQKHIKYKPYLFLPDNKNSNPEYRSLIGNKPLSKMSFDSTSEAKEFMEKYDDVTGFEYHGLTRWQYLFANDEYPGLVDFDLSIVKIGFLDIEVDSEGGFPNISQANKKVTAITLSDGVMFYVFGYHDFMTDDKNIEYIKCSNEKDMLYRFLDVWREMDMDIVTGWNVEGFDIPYLHKRISNICSEEDAAKMSPWGLTHRRKYHDKMGRENEAVTLTGIATLDYLALYLKFTYTKQEAYSLNYISMVELGDKKVDYRDLGYADLADLYKRNFQLFIEYNIHDVRLVIMLDKKMKFLDQAMAIAFDAKINFEDSVTSVLLWDIIIHNYLMDKKVIIPKQKNGKKSAQIQGAYVKAPKKGKYRWVVSFDLASLYPHLIMQYNISPETFLGRRYEVDADLVLSDRWQTYLDEAKEDNYTICGSGSMFRTDKAGVLAELMQKYYDDRSKYKKMMIDQQKLLVSDPDNEEIKRKIVQYNNMQMAKKIGLNSAYGALSNEWFRYYNDDLAEAVTMSGQVTIRWAADKINLYFNDLLKTDHDYVIASDTDSLYLDMTKLVDKFYPNASVKDRETCDKIVAFLDKVCNQKIAPYIDEIYGQLAVRMNAYQQKMQMKREAIAGPAIWTGAKRYVMYVWNNEGVQYKEPKFKMVGIEAIRSSTPTICRNIIKEGAKIMLDGDQDVLYAHVEKAKEMVLSAPVADVSRNSSINDIGKHDIGGKSIPPHVNGALAYNDMVRKKGLGNTYPLIKDGDRVKFFRLKMPNPTQISWMAFPNSTLPKEFGLEKYIDYDDLMAVGFLTPLDTLATAADLNIERKSSLADFFC